VVDFGVAVYYYISSDGAYTLSSMSDRLLFPLSFRQGLTHYDLRYPFIANVGEAELLIDNSDSDFTWSAMTGENTDKGVGANLAVLLSTNVDIGDTDSFSSDGATTVVFQGKVSEWEPAPGYVDDRVTRALIKDGMHRYTTFSVDGLAVQTNKNAQDLFGELYTQFKISLTSLWTATSSTNGEVFPLSFFDVYNGQTKLYTAAGKIARSELGHFYVENADVYAALTNIGTYFYLYKPHDDWIDQGSDILTLNNQWLDIDFTGQDEDDFYYPTNVTYNPTTFADTDVVLFQYYAFPTIKPGKTWKSIANYVDPDNKALFVTVIDSDLLTPVSGTDYVVTGVASSDLTVSLTNLGSAGKYVITNNGTATATFTTLQIRGKPIFQYNNVTLTNATTDAYPYENTFNYDLPYIADDAVAQSVLDYLGIVNQEHNLVRSVTFQAGADSDTFDIARNARMGDFVHITEDVNSIDEDFRIIGWEWDINSCEDILVTWFVFPDNLMALYMTDSDGAIMTDSDGNRFAFWR